MHRHVVFPLCLNCFPEAQFEIIKRDEGVSAVWRSRCVSLSPPFLSLFAMLQQAAGRYGPSCQRNFKSSLFPSVLIHVTQPWTSRPSLPPSARSLARVVCRELNDEPHRLHGESGRSDDDNSLIWLTFWGGGPKITSIILCDYFFLENRGTFFSPEICRIHFAVCCPLPDWKTNSPRVVVIMRSLFVWLELALLTLLSVWFIYC